MEEADFSYDNLTVKFIIGKKIFISAVKTIISTISTTMVYKKTDFLIQSSASLSIYVNFSSEMFNIICPIHDTTFGL